MKIEYNKNNKMVPFDSLNNGDVFIAYEKLFIKIDNTDIVQNAFNLTNNLRCLFNLDTLVEAVDATLVVNRK